MLTIGCRRLGVLAICLITWVSTPAAFAQTLYDFNLPPQALADSLRAIGHQTSVNILFDPRSVERLTAPAVHGQLSASQAVNRVLVGTNLAAEQTETNTLLVEPKDKAGKAQAAATNDPPDEVTGGSRKEAGKESSQDFRVAQVDQGKASSPSALKELATSQENSKSMSVGLQEIVVTANKRSESLQNVAASVSVESGEQLIARGQTQLADYAAYMPGLNVASNGSPGQTSVSIRGISSNTETSAVGTYLDDTPVGSSAGWGGGSYFTLDMLPYDLDRIEVLRGPQGTLYGAGAMGGLIKYVLKAPSTTEADIKVGADLTTIDGAGNLGYSVRARVSEPVINDLLGLSLSLFYNTTPGYMTNLYTGERDTNRDRQYGARFAAVWTPMSDLSVKVTALTQDIEADDLAVKQFGNSRPVPGTNAVVLVPTEPFPNLTEDFSFLQPFDQRIDYFAATVNWHANPFDVVSATSWSSAKSFIQNAYYTPAYGSILPELGGTAPGLANYTNYFGVNKFTQEIRLVSPKGETIEWLAGVFDTHENSFNTQQTVALTYKYQPTAPGNLFFGLFPETFDEYAAFADLTWNLTSAFSLTAGGRYADNHQKPNFYEAAGPFFPAPLYLQSATQEGVFTWMGTAQYRFDNDTMIYARAASGYRPGGPNIPGVGVPTSYSSDSLINYELGVKSTFLDRKAQVDFSVYRIDWTNIQLVATNSEGISYFANGAKARSQGLEFAGLYSLIPGLTLGINEAYTNAQLTAVSADASYLLTGYQLPLVPKENFSLTANYEWAFSDRWSAQVGGGYRYVGKEWLGLVESKSIATTPTVQAPSYSVVDLNASVHDQHVTFKLFVRNVANNLAISGPTANAGFQLVSPNSATGISQINTSFLQPRTVGLGIDYAF